MNLRFLRSRVSLVSLWLSAPSLFLSLLRIKHGALSMLGKGSSLNGYTPASQVSFLNDRCDLKAIHSIEMKRRLETLW